MKGVISVPRKQERKDWESLRAQNARGKYRLIEPLDYLILQELPDEGEMMGGYYPLATSVTSLKKKFKELSSNLLATRMRLLHMQELVVVVNTAGSKQSWQRTEKGKELLTAWQQQQK